tara:strand:- start:1738 stop:2124 length:387 start_codon:yes stop_codon:yes gene_type:complete
VTVITQKDVDRVVAVNPLLTAEGFEHGFKRTKPEYVPARISVKEMQGAVDWLEKADRIKSFNTTFSSYRLKHMAEKTAKGKYVSNGAFIAGAYFLGFKVKRIEDGPNAHINISSKWINKWINKWNNKI